METKKYLFQNSDGSWVFGLSVNDVCPAGVCRRDVSGNNITIRYVYNRNIADEYSVPFSDFKKENGADYASLSEFLTATTGFFASDGDATEAGITDLKNALAGNEGVIGSLTDSPASSTEAETATAQSSISLLKGIKNVLLLAVTALGSILTKLGDGTQKTQIADPATHPTILDIADELDTTDGSVIYRGYKRGASYLVGKQVVAGALISTTWATGAWADRATLTYA